MTLEQCWHRVPGGTAVAALAVAQRLGVQLEVRGVAAWHRRPPAEPWRPAVPVRRLPITRPPLYEAWLWARTPPVQLATGRVDVIHATTVLVPPRTAPLVVTLHDVAFLHEPSHFTARGSRLMRRGFERVKRHADVVLASSTATLEDCVAAGIDAARLRHVPLGVDVVPATAAEVAAARRRHRLDRPYVLAVGTLEPRKNLARLVDAFTRRRDDDRLLAIAGPAGWGAGGPPAAERVRLLGFVSGDDLRALYAGADLLAYPSLREGFGLPVAEAMAQGTPVVTSKGTSTEEVAGGAAVLVDPTDTDAIAAGIDAALADAEHLGRAGLARAGELTWERTAALTLDAYREAIG
jgi:glycosyltransferase involved in cell wall biosynthesis